MSEVVKQEEKKELPETVEVDGENVPIADLVQQFKGSKKTVAEYQRSQQELNAAKQELEVLKKEAGKRSKPKDDEEDDLDPNDEDGFLDKLTGTIKHLRKEIAEMKKGQGEYVDSYRETVIEEIGRKNQETLQKFVTDNELGDLPDDYKDYPADLKKILEIAYRSHHNRWNKLAKIPIIPYEALDDAILILNKDKIKDKIKSEGKEEILDEIFKGKNRKPKPKPEDEGDLAWAAKNWEKLTDAQREKYHKLVYSE